MTNIVGVVGTGASTRKHTGLLLDDWDKEHSITNIVLPGTEESFTDAVRHVADWAITNEKPISLVRSDTTEDAPWLEDYLPAANVATLVNADPAKYAATQVTHLLLAFDEHKEDVSTEIAEAALARGVVVMDLTDGLYPITSGETAPTETTPDPVVEPVAEPVVTTAVTPKPRAKRKSRAQANAEKVAEAAAVPPVEGIHSPPDQDEAQAVTRSSLPPVNVHFAPAAGLSDVDINKIAEAVFARFSALFG